MKVFISWSGERSKAVACFLREWLRDVIQGTEPWMSATDIQGGMQWSQEIARQLNECDFGVICLTPSNLSKPWLLFEAGALAKKMDVARVCPYLIGLDFADVPQGPLALFQAKKADRDGTLGLLHSVNEVLGEARLDPGRLDRLFDAHWGRLEDTLNNLPEEPVAVDLRRSVESMAEEILELVRGLPSVMLRMVEASPLERSLGWHGGIPSVRRPDTQNVLLTSSSGVHPIVSAFIPSLDVESAHPPAKEGDG